MDLKLVDICAGIGGFSLSAGWAGIETLMFCEIEKFPQQVLMKNFPGVAIHDDLKTLNSEIIKREAIKKYKYYDPNEIIFSAGIPCQPYSHAGKRKGEDDNRNLSKEYIRLIAECKPRWVIVENVAGLVSMENNTPFEKWIFLGVESKNTFRRIYSRYIYRKRQTFVLVQIIKSIEKEGYQVEIYNIPACGVQAWHKRERIWIVCHTKHNGSHGNEERRGNETNDSIRGEEEQIKAGESQGTSKPENEGSSQQSKGRGQSGEENNTQNVSNTKISKRKRCWNTRSRGDRLTNPCKDVSNSYSKGLRGSKKKGNLKESREDGSEFTTGHNRAGWPIRKFEPGLGGATLDGLSPELDENRLNNYGTSKKKRPDKILQTVQETTNKEKVQRSAGEHKQLSTEDLLQSGMYGKSNDPQEPFVCNYSEKERKTQESKLRTLRWNEKTAIAPYRRKLEEQQNYKPDDFVCFLSHQATSEEWKKDAEKTIGMQGLWISCLQAGYVPETLSEIFKIWKSITYKEKYWWIVCACEGSPFATEPDIPRVAQGVKDRVNRLKGIGNAIQSQVAYEFFKAILEFENQIKT